MYLLFVVPVVILLAGILAMIAAGRTKNNYGAIALKVIGTLLIIVSLMCFAGITAMLASFRAWN